MISEDPRAVEPGAAPVPVARAFDYNNIMYSNII